MQTESEAIRLQAEEHPLVPTAEFHSLEEYALYLIHLVAYEEAAKLAGGKDVLDIGCNTGYGTAIVARDSRATTGVDVSAKSVSAARELNAAPNLRYLAIDGLQLPFQDDAFDLAVSFQVVEHVFTPEAYLREIRRVLKPGGLAILTTPNATIRLYPGMKPWNKFHVREYAAAELRTLLEGTFPSVEIRGLFAEPPLYDIEFRRVQRAKEGTRRQREIEKRTSWKLKHAMKNVARRILPQAAIDAARRVLPRGKSSPAAPAVLPESVASRYSTADFYYRTENLDAALDLMAVCRK